MSKFVSDRYALPQPSNFGVSPAEHQEHQEKLVAIRDRALEDLGEAGHDVLAWCHASGRLNAAKHVASEREHAAAHALREAGYSIRETADIMVISPTRVTRLLTGPPQRTTSTGPGHLTNHISKALIAPHEMGYIVAEYSDAHDAAFRDYPPAQGHYSMGHDGLSLKKLGYLDG